MEAESNALHRIPEVLQRQAAHERIELVLGLTAGVSRAAYFGSTASGQTDEFSDIDLIVDCDATMEAAVVEVLHSAFDFALYRPVTEGRRPSGRYWFSTTHHFSSGSISASTIRLATTAC